MANEGNKRRNQPAAMEEEMRKKGIPKKETDMSVARGRTRPKTRERGTGNEKNGVRKGEKSWSRSKSRRGSRERDGVRKANMTTTTVNKVSMQETKGTNGKVEKKTQGITMSTATMIAKSPMGIIDVDRNGEITITMKKEKAKAKEDKTYISEKGQTNVLITRKTTSGRRNSNNNHK